MTLQSLLCTLSNRLWIALNEREHGRFLHSLDNVEEAQRLCLSAVVRRNADTRFGRKHGFQGISSVQGFQEHVPLTDYEDYLPYIDRIARGEARVLTADPVVLFEPSSGSSSASKLIPYTHSLKADFQRGIAPWIVSLYQRRPTLMGGEAYWSISPLGPRQQRHGVVPIGFAADADYLGFIGKRLHAWASTVPSGVDCLGDAYQFRQRTLVHLLASRRLALISVWSPTFLSLLLDQFLHAQEETLRALRHSGLPGATRRADAIFSMLRHEDGRGVFQRIWPHLSVISCWTHGPSEPFVNRLRESFPDVEIQGKGLLATEAFISLPLLPDRDPVLALNSHFLEFSDVDGGEIRPAHRLEEGQTYSVIVTTSGGLYRYRLRDLVKVTGFIGQAPTFRFVAKEALLSDLFGEKLHANHVQRGLEEVCSALSIYPQYTLLAPSKPSATTAAYTLFLEIGEIAVGQAERLRDALEEHLCENYHYAYCRRIGQLGALRLFLIDRSAGPPEEIFTSEMCRRGLRFGDIKPTILDQRMGWEHRFRGRFVLP